MTSSGLEARLVREYRDLVTLPEVALRVNEMVDDPDCNLHRLGEVISQDPALTMRLLGIANSPWYGLTREVENVGQAITLLGLQQVRNVVLAASVASAFERIPPTVLTLQDFWRHSLLCGLVAQYLGDGGDSRFGSLFTAGLLHDVGRLILCHRYPEAMGGVLAAGGDVIAAERARLDTDHGQVGAALARQWRLPELYITVIACHHDAAMAEPAHRPVVARVALANRLLERGAEEAVPAALCDWAEVVPADLGAALEAAQARIGALERAYFLR